MPGPVSQSVSEATFPPCHVISTVVNWIDTPPFSEPFTNLHQPNLLSWCRPSSSLDLRRMPVFVGSFSAWIVCCRPNILFELATSHWCALCPNHNKGGQSKQFWSGMPVCVYIQTWMWFPLPSKTASFAEGRSIVSRFRGSVGSRQIEVAGAEWEKLWHR